MNSNESILRLVNMNRVPYVNKICAIHSTKNEQEEEKRFVVLAFHCVFYFWLFE